MSVALPPFLTFYPSTETVESPPAIIVLQEWWGINDQIKLHAQKFAECSGAEVFVPDLYKGKIGVDAEEASHLMNNLDFKNAVDEIESLCDELRKDQPDRKIAIAGFCMGGALCLATAALSRRPVAAAIPFYGIPPSALCNVGDIPTKSPIQGHFGLLDAMKDFSDAEAVKNLEEKLKASIGDKPFEIHSYETEGHAFMNHDQWSMNMVKKLEFPGSFSQASRDLAWERVESFLKKHLY